MFQIINLRTEEQKQQFVNYERCGIYLEKQLKKLSKELPGYLFKLEKNGPLMKRGILFRVEPGIKIKPGIDSMGYQIESYSPNLDEYAEDLGKGAKKIFGGIEIDVIKL